MGSKSFLRVLRDIQRFLETSRDHFQSLARLATCSSASILLSCNDKQVVTCRPQFFSLGHLPA
jgi:hypothetical protein